MKGIVTSQQPQVHGEAPIILTFNLSHFRPEHLAPWRIAALHPQSFLVAIFHQEQELVLARLEQQATDHRRSLGQLLQVLSATAPDFVAVVTDAI